MTRIHIHLTRDSEFRESDHPRDSDGKFGSGGGGKSGKSDYAKAREAEHDDRRDAEYATRRKAQTEAEEKATAEAKAKAAAMSPAQREKRLAVAKGMLDRMEASVPLREKVKLTREIRALEALQEPKKEAPEAPKGAGKGEPAAETPKAKEQAKRRESYQTALRVGNMAEARRLLAEIRKADRELDKGGSAK